MKRNILYTLIITLLLASCMAEQDNPLIVATCTDGIRNGNETDIDCGGHCQACEGKTTLAAPCASALTTNVMMFNNTNVKFAAGANNCLQTSEHFEFQLAQSNYKILIELNGIRPQTSKIYKLAGEWTAGDNEAVLIISASNGRTYIAMDGYLYVTILNDEMIVEFCSIQMRESYSGSTNTIISGKLIGC